MQAIAIVVKPKGYGTDRIIADALDVDKSGTLRLFNTSVTVETTTKKKWFGQPETKTEIKHKRYTSAMYAKGSWVSAYSEVTLKPKELGSTVLEQAILQVPKGD